MRLCWFGIELDLTLSLPSIQLYLGPTTVDDEPVQDLAPDRGDSTSYAINFTRPEVPWEDAGSYHQFDPEPDGEDA